MTRSARGTVEEPGRNVAAKSGLNRALLDAGLGQLATLIGEKAAWAARTVIGVDARYSSQTCAQCGHVSKRVGRVRALRASGAVIATTPTSTPRALSSCGRSRRRREHRASLGAGRRTRPDHAHDEYSAATIRRIGRGGLIFRAFHCNVGPLHMTASCRVASSLICRVNCQATRWRTRWRT
jgi:hypothetical protein